jgi:hypothetical protein
MNKQSFKHAFTLSMVYLIFGLAWIYFSDALVASISPNNEQLTLLQTYKGWFFIVFTTIILFIMSNRFFYKEFLIYSRHMEEQEVIQQQLKLDILLIMMSMHMSLMEFIIWIFYIQILILIL